MNLALFLAHAQYDDVWRFCHHEILVGVETEAREVVNTADCDGVTEAYVCGPFGVRKKGALWKLTHLASGLAIGGTYRTDAELRALVNSLAFVLDWWQPNPRAGVSAELRAFLSEQVNAVSWSPPPPDLDDEIPF